MCKTLLNLIWPTVRCDRFPFQAVERTDAGVLAARCVANFVTFFQIVCNYANWTSKQMWLCGLNPNMTSESLHFLASKPYERWNQVGKKIRNSKGFQATKSRISQSSLKGPQWEISCLARCNLSHRSSDTVQSTFNKSKASTRVSHNMFRFDRWISLSKKCSMLNPSRTMVCLVDADLRRGVFVWGLRDHRFDSLSKCIVLAEL